MSTRPTRVLEKENAWGDEDPIQRLKARLREEGRNLEGESLGVLGWNGDPGTLESLCSHCERVIIFSLNPVARLTGALTGGDCVAVAETPLRVWSEASIVIR